MRKGMWLIQANINVLVAEGENNGGLMAMLDSGIIS